MRDNNPSVKIVQTPNKGRSAFSSRPLKAGETLLTDSPLLLYSAAPLSAASAYCHHCFRTLPPTPPPLPCPQCGTVSLFCSPRCLSSALSTSHTPFVCRALSRLAAPLLRHPPDRHAQARFLVSAYNLAVASPSRFRALLDLQGGPFIDETSTFLHSVVSSVWGPLSIGEFGSLSLEMTAALLVKDRVNAFGLMEPFRGGGERSVRAYGIYPVASFFNHDCLPNACRFDYVDSVGVENGNTDVVVRVLHDLPAGREICLSYFPVNVRYKERQQRLKDDYGFACDCGRCEVEAKWSDNEEERDDEMDNDMIGDGEEDDDFPHQYFFVRFMCSRENCGGTLAPLPPADARPSTVMECNVCGNLSNAEE